MTIIMAVIIIIVFAFLQFGNNNYLKIIHENFLDYTMAAIMTGTCFKYLKKHFSLHSLTLKEGAGKAAVSRSLVATSIGRLIDVLF